MEPDWVAISKSNNLRPILKATISEQNPPEAEFTYTPTDPIIDQQINFDASLGTDIDGAITTYNWDFGDESGIQTGAVIDHAYQNEGTYTITLTVTDDAGLTDTQIQTITIPIPT